MGRILAVLTATMALLLMAVAPAPVRAAGVTSVVVIVNSANPDSNAKDKKLQDKDIKDFFLMNKTTWGDADKTEVRVYPMVSSRDEAKLFQKKMVALNEDELAAHWRKKKEDGGLEQPKGRKDSAEVFRLVSKDQATGAIGYVDKAHYDGLGEDEKKKVIVVYTVSDN